MSTDSIAQPGCGLPSAKTDIPALRLNLLRLTYSHARTAQDAIDRAKELEAHCLAGESARQGRKAQS